MTSALSERGRKNRVNFMKTPNLFKERGDMRNWKRAPRLLIIISVFIFALPSCRSGYQGKAVRVVFDLETLTVGGPGLSSTMDVFYEGIVKSFKDHDYLVLDVYQSTENILKSKDNPAIEEKRIELKDKIYTVKILAENLKEYLEGKKKKSA